MKQIQMTKNPSFSLISTKKIIQMSDVWTSYDSKNFALEGINLSIDRGTNYAIIGQSGSGKSTLLKLMNGMMIPSKGTIKIDYVSPNMNEKKFKNMMHTIGLHSSKSWASKKISQFLKTLFLVHCLDSIKFNHCLRDFQIMRFKKLKEF